MRELERLRRDEADKVVPERGTDVVYPDICELEWLLRSAAPLLRLVRVAAVNPVLTLGVYELPHVWRDITVDDIQPVLVENRWREQ